MSNISKEALLKSFPDVLTGAEAIAMIASITAEELMELYEQHDLLAIFSKIDQLGDELLNILAKDFKIDWWDTEASLETKRKVFKNCFLIHRSLGTVKAVKQAISDAYTDSDISEWTDYGGKPYHFKILINRGNEFYSSDDFQMLKLRASYYTNVRSVLDSIKYSAERTVQLYIGCAAATGVIASYNVDGIDIDDFDFLADEDGNWLMDGNGDFLIE